VENTTTRHPDFWMRVTSDGARVPKVGQDDIRLLVQQGLLAVGPGRDRVRLDVPGIIGRVVSGVRL